MKMTTKDFCKEYLIEEWWASDKSDISVPAPRRDFTRIADKSWFKDLGAKPMEFLLQMEIKRNGKGFVKASWSHNLITGVACIFLDKNNKCLIHKSKPEECRTSFGCGSKKENGNNRVAVLAYWKKHQDWIEKQTNESDN
jgi:Fe-S-cluster containining protein